MTAFTDTWNATYLTLPADSENISLGASRIRDLKNDITQRMQVDHSWVGDANDGAHNQVTLKQAAGDPAADVSATAGFLYTKASSLGGAGTTEVFFKDAAGNVMQLTEGGAPVGGAPGDVIPSCATSRPGCVLCDGTSYLRTGIYAKLFAAIGTTWGFADGSHFNVPDFRGRTLVGAGQGAGLTLRSLGQQTIGEETHILLTAELPAHNHTATVTDPGHAHVEQVGNGVGGGPLTANGIFNTASGPSNVSTMTATTGITVATANTGTGTAHNVMQPSAVVNWFIHL